MLRNGLNARKMRRTLNSGDPAVTRVSRIRVRVRVRVRVLVRVRVRGGIISYDFALHLL